jgi:hypothetical protein
VNPSNRRLAAILLLLAAAFCSHRASTLTWGEAQAPQQIRYRLAANGMAKLAGPGDTLLDTCHWFPLRGTDPLCQAAPGQERRFTRLTYAYPALQAGAWLSFLATVVLLLAGPPAATFTRAVVALATIATVLGSVLVVADAPAAVLVLGELPFSYGGPGPLLGGLAPLLATTGGWLVPGLPTRTR